MTRRSGSPTSIAANNWIGCTGASIVITSDGIYRDPAETLRRIRSALVDCGAVKVRKTFKDEWRLHFPVS